MPFSFIFKWNNLFTFNLSMSGVSGCQVNSTLEMLCCWLQNQYSFIFFSPLLSPMMVAEGGWQTGSYTPKCLVSNSPLSNSRPRTEARAGVVLENQKRVWNSNTKERLGIKTTNRGMSCVFVHIKTWAILHRPHTSGLFEHLFLGTLGS